MAKGLRLRNLFICFICLLIVMNAGCIGQFKLTSNLHSWNVGLEGKWIQELVFIGFVIIPVYGFSMLADALVINTMEFWSEKNPLDSSSTAVFEDGPYTVRLERSETPEGRQLSIRVFEDGKLVEEQLLTARPDGTIVKHAPDGTLLVSGTFEPSGKVVVRDEVRDLTLLAIDRDSIPDLTR